MFIKIPKIGDGRETLVQVSSIWKIDVQYCCRDEQGRPIIDSRRGRDDPEAVTSYTIYYGSEKAVLWADPDNPAMQVIEQLYNDAIG